MDLKYALKEAKTLINEKKSEQAFEKLDKALNILQTQPPNDLSQEDRLLLESEIQEGLADAMILNQRDQEALSHLLASMTQLQTYESLTQSSPDELLFRVYRKMSSAFDRLGQQFESEKYLRKAGEIKAAIFKTEIHKKLKDKGYSIKENFRAVETEASPVDILAEKGTFKKTRIAIWLCLDESEVDTIAFLTKGYASYAQSRYILLLMGQATIPTLQGAKIVSSIDQIKI